ncbi:MAG: hypothetical protein GYA15_00155 [Leptolinea sp.]|jgi:hypothetical protein|nr:hypothetical protein [Leptolinea sp.]
MELGEVLSKAWKIIWKNKVLWIFGFLSSCGRSGGGGGGGGKTNFNLPTNNGQFNNSSNPFSNGQIPGLEEFQHNFENLAGSGGEMPWGLIVGLICLVVFIVLIAAMLGTIGRIGLIRGTVLAEEGQEPLHFGQVWSASTPYFWRVFFLNLLAGLAISLALLILIIPMIFFSIGTMGIGLLCLIPLICLIIPLSLAIDVVLEQVNAAMVVENLGLWDSVKRGWQVCRENFGPVAVVALVVIVGGGIIGFILALPLVLVALPMVIGGISQDQTALTSGLTVSGALLCCLLPFIILLQGILSSYIGSIWTLTFLRLTAKTPVQLEALPVP